MADSTTEFPIVLTPGLQNYPWGDPETIPRLFGFEPTGEPFAEAWLGAHVALSATAQLPSESVPLAELLSRHAPAVLGNVVFERYRGLPFLLKVLAARQPLSIQVHPSRAQAIQGYAEDDESGVELGAAARRYRDKNHKPELIVALEEFYALCGFRSSEQIRGILAETGEIAARLPAFDGTSASLKRVVSAYLQLADEDLLPALERWIERLKASTTVGPLDPRYWVLQAHRVFGRPGRPDRGLFLVMLLNLIRLDRGQGLYLDAGVPHAYLRGAGVEVMANSDNVIRAGLTSKHVDVGELLRIVRFEFRVPDLVTPLPTEEHPESRYCTSAEEFELRTLELDANGSAVVRTADGPEVLLVVSAEERRALIVGVEAGRVELGRGGSCLIPSGVRYSLSSRSAVTVVRTVVPSRASDAVFRGRRPTELAFGTSGLRGLVSDMTDLEAYVNTRGFLEYLVQTGDASPGMRVGLAGDLRPSTDSPERSILRAVARAVTDSGFHVVNYGKIPTPALTYAALAEKIPSIMVTGSHIPFDRNGIKFNKSTGEVLKRDERGILEAVGRVRRREYTRPKQDSPFADDGMFGVGQAPLLPPVEVRARSTYIQRYLDFFEPGALEGLRVVLYEHSAVGREVVAEVLERLGANVLPLGRTPEFTAIDTENVSKERVRVLAELGAEARQHWGAVDAIVSTDGDSDRPLVVSVDREGRVRFIPGDLLGLLTAGYLEADAIAVPVSATDSVELLVERRRVEVRRTKIGSPWVIEAMQTLPGLRRVGWESNGGFLVGSDIERGNRLLRALPTRDAMLPIVCVLHMAQEGQRPLERLLMRLPSRFSKAGLLDSVPAATGALLARYLTSSDEVVEAEFEGDTVLWTGRDGSRQVATGRLKEELLAVRQRFSRHMGPELGLCAIRHLNFVDGVRATFDSGEIAHVRPSGNAPQLRMYAVASSEGRAEEIIHAAIADGGILQRLVQDAQAWRFVDSIRKNIATTDALFEGRGPGILVGTVSGSRPAQGFWKRVLLSCQRRFAALQVVSLHEDLPVNQAFGVLLMWQRLRGRLAPGVGALMAFVFGEGSRATPFTETENGQKPAILTAVAKGADGAQLSMVEVALRYFAPVEAYLRRSGFDGVVIKWGDEVQIPTLDLAGQDPRLLGADIVRFVSIQPVTEEDAQNKDWVGVDAAGNVTGFIPRRPLRKMRMLADRGLLHRQGAELVGGINLGSIAMSKALLDALLEEFHAEVNDAQADRLKRPDLDPQMFSALTVAALERAEERARAWQEAVEEVDALRRLEQMLPGIVPRLRGVLDRFEARQGRRLKMVAVDFGAQYWGDIGHHRMIYDYYMSLNATGATGEVARAAAGLAETRDADGNLIAGTSRLGGVRVRNSVVIDCDLRGPGDVTDSVLIGTRAGKIHACRAFDVKSAVGDLNLSPRSGTYRVVTAGSIRLAEGERVTTAFLSEDGMLLRVFEDTDLRDRAANYDVPILGNPISFSEAHAAALQADPEEVARRRARAERRVVDGLSRQ